FNDAWAAGRAWPRHLAVAGAGALLATPTPAAPRLPQLTRRERDVLRELSAGKSNREIGEALFVSPTTVATHVASLYRKIGVNSRAQAVAWAHRHETL
ncbi:MAG: response regulator transcription factor, partial [Thermomicrobiales bacterium]|nr:response regulator transcription factor [Thermomicrobiales bacterium]